MKYDDKFTPENVEEQIDQLASPLFEGSSPGAQVVQQLREHYAEDRRSARRMWNRLAQYVTEHDIEMQPGTDRPGLSREARKERIRPMKPESFSARRKISRVFALIAATLCTVVLVGSLLLVLQALRSSHTRAPTTNVGSESPASHGLYIYKKDLGLVEKIDLHTRNTLWQTAVPSTDLHDGGIISLGDAVYLGLRGKLLALDANNGHIRWTQNGLKGFLPLFLADGMLYMPRNTIGPGPQLYALDPADGTVKDSYTFKDAETSWSAEAINDGILYYYIFSTSSLYAERLSDKTLLWQKKIDIGYKVAMGPLRVKNGMVYAAINSTEGEAGTTNAIVMAFDAETGEKRWQSNTMSLLMASLEVTDTSVYTASTGELDAFDAHTGKLLWRHQNKMSRLRLVLDSGKLYISYWTQKTAGGIAELKPEDGTHLWDTSVSGQEEFSPLGVRDGVIYTLSNEGNGKSDAIDAFNTSNGSRLWHMSVGDLSEVVIAFG